MVCTVCSPAPRRDASDFLLWSTSTLQSRCVALQQEWLLISVTVASCTGHVLRSSCNVPPAVLTVSYAMLTQKCPALQFRVLTMVGKSCISAKLAAAAAELVLKHGSMWDPLT